MNLTSMLPHIRHVPLRIIGEKASEERQRKIYENEELSMSFRLFPATEIYRYVSESVAIESI